MNTILIGAGYAGMLAALRLAGKSRQQNITLVNPTDTFVDRIRLHQRVAGEAQPTRSIPAMLRGTGIQFVQARVTALDPNQREITLQNGSETRRMRYDALIYTLGSSVDTSVVPGIKEYALTLNQSAQMKAKLEANPRLLRHAQSRQDAHSAVRTISISRSAFSGRYVCPHKCIHLWQGRHFVGVDIRVCLLFLAFLPLGGSIFLV